jgi:hypothetical protein
LEASTFPESVPVPEIAAALAVALRKYSLPIRANAAARLARPNTMTRVSFLFTVPLQNQFESRFLVIAD